VTHLEIAPRAQGQVRQISAWWSANREAAPNLFVEELAARLEALVAAPHAGALYAERRGVVIRRALLRRSGYHVYFSYDPTTEIIAVRAVWHSARGHGPIL
jgi:plasmid stabilization system protein ParE